jgi:signal transduction histidine kinase
MMLFKRLPVRTKIVAVTMLTATAALLLTGLTLFWYETHDFQTKLQRELTTLAQVIGANSVAAVSFGDEKAAAEMLGALRIESQILVAAIYVRNNDSSGAPTLLATYSRDGTVIQLPSAPGADGFVRLGDRLRYFGAINDEREHKRTGTIFFESDLNGIRQRIGTYARLLGLVLAASCCVAFALATVLQHYISAPIISLASTTKQVAANRDYSVRVTRDSEDEFGQLASEFNEMIAQVESRDRALRKKNAELVAANKELDAFSYSVSHDLRAPLRHINGYASMLVGCDGAALSPKGQKYLDNISAAAKQMGELIDNLLEFARMGRTEIRVQSVDLRAVAEEVVTTLRTETAQRTIHWKINPLPVVPGDRAMLRQVFANLLSNAAKYTRQRDVAEIEIGSRQDSLEEVVLFVRDNGAGFSMKYAEKLFGVFQRLHSAQDFEGTGIGLANVRRIIARHGGRTWAEGEENVGATFFFSLPSGKPDQ